MGLDMYMYRIKKHPVFGVKTLMDVANEVYDFGFGHTPEGSEIAEGIKKAFKGQIVKQTRYDHCGEREYLSEQVAYWRKANAIHKWIYENCAKEGQKDYENIIINKEKIKELVELTGTILENKDSIDPKNYLETEDGFFFGSLKYDEWYWEYVVYTHATLKKTLLETDWENEFVYYNASY